MSHLDFALKVLGTPGVDGLQRVEDGGAISNSMLADPHRRALSVAAGEFESEVQRRRREDGWDKKKELTMADLEGLTDDELDAAAPRGLNSEELRKLTFTPEELYGFPDLETYLLHGGAA